MSQKTPKNIHSLYLLKFKLFSCNACTVIAPEGPSCHRSISKLSTRPPFYTTPFLRVPGNSSDTLRVSRSFALITTAFSIGRGGCVAIVTSHFRILTLKGDSSISWLLYTNILLFFARSALWRLTGLLNSTPLQKPTAIYCMLLLTCTAAKALH